MINLNTLNNDCFVLILNELSVRDLGRVARVDRTLRERVYHCTQVWQKHLKNDCLEYTVYSPCFRGSLRERYLFRKTYIRGFHQGLNFARAYTEECLAVRWALPFACFLVALYRGMNAAFPARIPLNLCWIHSKSGLVTMFTYASLIALFLRFTRQRWCTPVALTVNDHRVANYFGTLRGSIKILSTQLTRRDVLILGISIILLAKTLD